MLKHLAITASLVGSTLCLATTDSFRTSFVVSTVNDNQPINSDFLSSSPFGDDEIPSSEIEAGFYIYSEAPSPYFKGPVSITKTDSNTYVLKGNRLFKSGATSPLNVILKAETSEKNLFRGKTQLYFYGVGPCKGQYAPRTVELRTFEDSSSKVNLFYFRETGYDELWCRYKVNVSKPYCRCWWQNGNYDFTHPKSYTKN